jgi:hypothetical protein
LALVIGKAAATDAAALGDDPVPPATSAKDHNTDEADPEEDRDREEIREDERCEGTFEVANELHQWAPRGERRAQPDSAP